MALFLAYVVKLTGLTRYFVSVVPEFQIHEASRTSGTLRNLTIDLHLFTYIYDFIMTPEAEKFNGCAAMLGFVAAFGAYATTGQIIPGIF